VRPPRADKRPLVDTWHGHIRIDDYAWIRAANWREVMRDPAALPLDIRSYLEAENAYADAVMSDTSALQEALFAEMKGRIKEDDSSVPAPDGPFAYYLSYVEGAQYPLYKRIGRDLRGVDTVLLDGNRESEGKPFFRLGGVSRSPDHRQIAWSFDDKGSEFYRIHVRDLLSGQDLADEIDHTSGGAVWSKDGRSFFYTQLDENHRPLRVLRHIVGTPQSTDKVVYEESDHGFFVGAGKTLSDRFIIIHTHDHETSEVYLIDGERPDEAPRLIAERRAGVEYDIENWRDKLIIRTNADGAEDYKIVIAPESDPSPSNWRDLVPHRLGRLILGTIVFKNWLVRLERENGLPRIVVRDMTSSEEHSIAFAEEAYSLGFGDMLEHDTDTLRFTYSSMTTPGEVFDYDMRTRERILRKRQEVPSGHDPALYVTRRIEARADDGETIPVTLLHRRETPLDGSAPVWLYGYGAYGITIPAAFNTNVLSLVDRGFIYAIAHVRGGKDKGYRWYTQGKRDKKLNSFRDFAAVARHLIAANLTSPKRIVAQGGSAGGMLMGAVANMAPEIFGGILAEVPFVDVLATMLDDTLPLTPPEWQEWGNPIASKADYELIASYSPYDNVRAQDYPHVLAVGGLTDPRVTYWEPAKWVARLRELKTDANYLLLKTYMGAGHAGASGRFDKLKEVAFVYAFGIKVAGLVQIR
jgi:oligopeptidase B